MTKSKPSRRPQLRSPLVVTPANIDQYTQNRVKLIADDLLRLYDVPIYATERICMARGVYKWFAGRRDVIRLKNDWKLQIRILHLTATGAKGSLKKVILAHIKTLVECRQALRAICHSRRWRWSDLEKPRTL